MNISKNLPKGKAGGYLALSITSIVWGTTWVASKIAVTDMPALQMASIRSFSGAAFLFCSSCSIKRSGSLPVSSLAGC